jgi:hypothetical protein|uniref:Uncharacterized protein n=1 Tax=Eutreptiella gymnastica TaxID=73025 RepID=A0A7S4LHV0_9EUGL
MQQQYGDNADKCECLGLCAFCEYHLEAMHIIRVQCKCRFPQRSWQSTVFQSTAAASAQTQSKHHMHHITGFLDPHVKKCEIASTQTQVPLLNLCAGRTQSLGARKVCTA